MKKVIKVKWVIKEQRTAPEPGTGLQLRQFKWNEYKKETMYLKSHPKRRSIYVDRQGFKNLPMECLTERKNHFWQRKTKGQ